MVHKMNLRKEPFDKIASGKKTIELRLYDEKRRAVSVGDVIVFNCIEDSVQISTTVTELYVFDSFEELYENLPLDRCGYSSDEITAAHWSDMGRYYSEDEMKKYGVVGIELALIK